MLLISQAMLQCPESATWHLLFSFCTFRTGNEYYNFILQKDESIGFICPVYNLGLPVTVVDFIKTLFVNFPVYNFADCLITCGAFSLIIYLVYEIVRDTKAEKKKAEDKDSE